MTYKLMQAFSQLHRQKLSFRPVQGYNPGEIRVLRSIAKLDQGQGLMVSELGSVLKVSSPFITQRTNELVKQGLVVRATDPEDRRAVRLKITPRGEEVLAKAVQEYSAFFAGLAKYLGQEQTEDLVRLLHQVQQYFESVEVRNGD